MKRLYAPFFALLLVTACKSKKEDPKQNNAPPPPVIVDVIIAGNTTLSNTIEVNGSVVASESANLQPEISGRLTYLNLPEGGRVNQGTVLAKINDADLQAAQSKTKVLLDMAQKTEERLRKLLAVNGINQADYDLALNQVNGFKADLRVTQAQIDKTVIRAPFSGVLGLRMVSPGTYVTPATILATIQQTDRVKIDFSVPEIYTNLIQRGKTIVVQTNDNNTKRRAVINATEPLINATTRNLKVRALLEGSPLASGAFVKVLLETGGRTNSILVPTNAIIPDARAKKVVVVKDGKGKLVDIETGLRARGTAEVTRGLKAGDSIAVTGVLFVRPNSLLKVRSVKQLAEFMQ